MRFNLLASSGGWAICDKLSPFSTVTETACHPFLELIERKNKPAQLFALENRDFQAPWANGSGFAIPTHCFHAPSEPQQFGAALAQIMGVITQVLSVFQQVFGAVAQVLGPPADALNRPAVAAADSMTDLLPAAGR